MAQTNVQAFSGDVEIADGLTVFRDIESSNSFITERVLFRETWPNGLNSLVGDLGTWVVTNLDQQSNPGVQTTPDGYGIVAFRGDGATNGEFVSPAFDLSDYAIVDGTLQADDKRKTTTRVFMKFWLGTRQLDDSGEVLQVQFSPDNGTTWYTVATSQDRLSTTRFTMVSADLSPYILSTGTPPQAKIRFYLPWAVAAGDYVRIGRIWIHESDVPTNLGGMWLGAGGKIGIGTDTPDETLSIYKEDTTAAGETVLSSITGVFSGSDATGGNINNTGLYINLDSSATGGTAINTEEHRVWGIDVDIDVTGDSDEIKGGRFLVTSSMAANGSDQTTNIYGIDAQGQHKGSGPNTNIIGVNARSFKGSDSTGLTDTMISVQCEYEINAGTCTDAYGVRSRFDRNGGAVTNSYLFYGDHLGSTTTITNNYGLYVAGADKHYLEGNVGIGTETPGAPLEVHGADLNGQPVGTTGIISRHVSGGDGVLNIFGVMASNNEETLGLQTQIDGRAWQSDIDGGWSYGSDTRYDLILQPYKGNVGIGTTNPEHTLHVHGSSTNHNGAPDGSTDSGLILLRNTKTGSTPYSMALGVDQTYGFGYLNAAGASAVQPICINTRGGNVGIGTTNPSSYLSISGNYSNSQAPVTYNSAPPLCVVNPTADDAQPICQFRTNQGITNVRNDGIYHKRGNGDILQLFTSASNVRFGNGTTGALLQLHNNGTAYFNCPLRADSYNNNSDDRVKHNESSIKNAIQTLFKLKPQKYDKVSMDNDVLEHSQYLNATDKEGYEWNDIEDAWIKPKPITSSACITETGLIAQDIWYDAPELRHIVSLPDDAIPDDTKPSEPDPGNIRSDPDYDSAGWGKMGTATVNYINLIPYMIKSIKELYNEVTRHKTRVPTELYSNVQNYRHMIVSKHGDNIQLANTENDKAVHGVISDIKTDTDNYEILIEHIGMGNVWVLNTGSNIEVGDYITTSNITGYGMLQDSTFFMNHTIGKSTIDCDFTVQTTPIKQKIRRLQDKTHWIKTARLVQCSLMAYSNLSNDTRATEIETYYNVYENSNTEHITMQSVLDNEHPFEITESEMNFEKYSNTYAVNTPFHTGPQTRTNYYRKRISKLENELEGYEPIVEQEMMDVLDDNGQVQWEDTGDTRPLYDLRYLTIDGSITDQSNAVYTASLVPISLHL